MKGGQPFSVIKQYWEDFVEFRFNGLKALYMHNVMAIIPEIKFIKFVLQNAPLLEKFHTNLRYPLCDFVDNFYEEDILSFPRASTRIEFCFSCVHLPFL